MLDAFKFSRNERQDDILVLERPEFKKNECDNLNSAKESEFHVVLNDLFKKAINKFLIHKTRNDVNCYLHNVEYGFINDLTNNGILKMCINYNNHTAFMYLISYKSNEIECVCSVSCNKFGYLLSELRRIADEPN